MVVGLAAKGDGNGMIGGIRGIKSAEDDVGRRLHSKIGQE